MRLIGGWKKLHGEIHILLQSPDIIRVVVKEDYGNVAVRMNSFKYNQQDATLYNIVYYCQCCTCFRRVFCPSSGAPKLYTQHRVYVTLACCYRQR